MDFLRNKYEENQVFPLETRNFFSIIVALNFTYMDPKLTMQNIFLLLLDGLYYPGMWYNRWHKSCFFAWQPLIWNLKKK